MAWPINPRPAKSLLVLRDQIDAHWPTRAKGNDGMLASVQHHAANPNSDHEANAAGVVTAMDITKDPAHGLDSRAVAQALLDSRDSRIKYIISDGQICSSKVSPWVWRPYSGADDHSHHFHLSVDADPALYDDTRPWNFDGAVSISKTGLVTAAQPTPQPIPTPPPTKESPMDLFKFLPLLMRILQIIPQIQTAAKAGTNIFTLLQNFAPDLLSILTGVGSTLFPELPKDSQTKVGAVMMDPTKVMWIQNAINTLGLANPPLIVDGSYGQMTKAAVTAFQTAHNVTPADGWAGDVTEAALRVELNKKSAPAPTTTIATGPTVSLAVPTP